MATQALITKQYLTDIADAIRSKNGTEETYTPAEMSDAIENIKTDGITPAGGLDITTEGTHDVTKYASVDVDISSSMTATADDILSGKTAVSGGKTITGTIPTHAPVNETIGTLSSSVSLSKGYYSDAGSVSIDEGEQAKIIPENIKAGVKILGVTGTLEASEPETPNYIVESTSPEAIILNGGVLGKFDPPMQLVSYTISGVPPDTQISFRGSNEGDTTIAKSLDSFTTSSDWEGGEMTREITDTGAYNYFSISSDTDIYGTEVNVSITYVTGVEETPTVSTTKYGVSIDNILGDVDSIGYLRTVSETFDISFDGVKDIVSDALLYKFYNNSNVRNIKFPDLEYVSCYSALSYAFSNCKNVNIGTGLLTDLSFPKLKSVTGSRAFYNAFFNCKSITKVVFPELVRVTGGSYSFGYAFKYCTSLEDVYFPKLERINADFAFSQAFSNITTIIDSITFPSLTSIAGNGAFYQCFENSYVKNICFPVLKTIGTATNNDDSGIFEYAFRYSYVTSLEFPELEEIYVTDTDSANGTFAYNGTLTSMSFPKLKVITYSPAYTGTVSNLQAHKSIFYGCSKLKELHFGAANQAAIEATDGYPTLWGLGAGNATVYFDLDENGNTIEGGAEPINWSKSYTITSGEYLDATTDNLVQMLRQLPLTSFTVSHEDGFSGTVTLVGTDDYTDLQSWTDVKTVNLDSSSTTVTATLDTPATYTYYGIKDSNNRDQLTFTPTYKIGEGEKVPTLTINVYKAHLSSKASDQHTVTVRLVDGTKDVISNNLAIGANSTKEGYHYYPINTLRPLSDRYAQITYDVFDMDSNNETYTNLTTNYSYLENGGCNYNVTDETQDALLTIVNPDGSIS